MQSVCVMLKATWFLSNFAKLLFSISFLTPIKILLSQNLTAVWLNNAINNFHAWILISKSESIEFHIFNANFTIYITDELSYELCIHSLVVHDNHIVNFVLMKHYSLKLEDVFFFLFSANVFTKRQPIQFERIVFIPRLWPCVNNKYISLASKFQRNRWSFSFIEDKNSKCTYNSDLLRLLVLEISMIG